jgi:hypothetical protein
MKMLQGKTPLFVAAVVVGGGLCIQGLYWLIRC